MPQVIPLPEALRQPFWNAVHQIAVAGFGPSPVDRRGHGRADHLRRLCAQRDEPRRRVSSHRGGRYRYRLLAGLVVFPMAFTFGLPVGVLITAVVLSWHGAGSVARGLAARSWSGKLIVWTVRWLAPPAIALLRRAMALELWRHRILPQGR